MEYIIPDWALDAIVNDDFSMMEETTIDEIKNFINAIPAKHLALIKSGNLDRYCGHYAKNDIDNCSGDCVKFEISEAKHVVKHFRA